MEDDWEDRSGFDALIGCFFIKYIAITEHHTNQFDSDLAVEENHLSWTNPTWHINLL